MPIRSNSEGTTGVLECRAPGHEGNGKAACKEVRDSDDDCIITGGDGFQMPPRLHPQNEHDILQPLSRVAPGDGICRFTIKDFTPRAECPNPYLRQSIGKYLPWLHNCGEDACPFTEPPAYMRRLSLETGQPLPNSQLSPGDHVRVDRRAFVQEVHVKVNLDVLGYDRGMWGGLEYFSGHVVDRYYHDITGFPMFSVDFGGSIGKREVKVCETVDDSTKAVGGGAQRSLDFGSSSPAGIFMPSTMPSPPRSSAAGPNGEGSSRGPFQKKQLVRGPAVGWDIDMLHPDAPLLSDSDVDVEWMAGLEDFDHADGAHIGKLLGIHFALCSAFVVAFLFCNKFCYFTRIFDGIPCTHAL
jgi:hypothetical protein